MSEQKTPPDAADKSENRLFRSDARRAAEELLERLRKERAERKAEEQARPGPKSFMRMRPTERILFHLKHHGQEVFGLKIYRLTYEDDAAWQKFMDLLNSETRNNLTREGALPEGEELLSMLDWAVEDNKEVWNGASFEQVYRHFQYTPETAGVVQRQIACIVVDAEALQSIIDDKKRAHPLELRKDTPFVKVLDTMLRLPPGGYHNRQEELDRFEKMGDDAIPKKIRYMKVDPSVLLPHFYDRLQVCFDEVYHQGPRPPYISHF
ncbi:hypothetical protein DIS24_g8621 [Lasiodiplodia hormozganensis]|uniref:Uncharacterized protein n=1 Tax=Lasiodiplodia hormozganensis TaxID=869390 RepID=A0AA39Y588_9PEZI|nr:hypothetical protein DIS24_g8621 [Lasiodiplodia hormozganensis]